MDLPVFILRSTLPLTERKRKAARIVPKVGRGFQTYIEKVDWNRVTLGPRPSSPPRENTLLHSVGVKKITPYSRWVE